MKTKNPVDFIRSMVKSAHVQRFHQFYTNQDHSIARHSWGVAMLCDVLSKGNPTVELLQWATYHDMAERETGDIPATTKWSSETLAGVIHGMEAKFNEVHGIRRIEDLPFSDRTIFHWADALEGMFSCYEEKLSGNNNLSVPFYKWEEHLKGLPVQLPIGIELLDCLVFAYENLS